MPAWLVPLAAGAASLAGQLFANKGNRDEAAKNRDFQQDNSNTSALRAVQDYRNAGLNPALAYDRGASTPGGAQAQIGNVIEPAISSARNAAMQKQQMQIADNDMRMRNELMTTQMGANRAANARDTAQANLTAQQTAQAIQALHFNLRLQPSLFKQSEATADNIWAQARINEYGMPAARNAATFENMMGKGGPILTKGILPALQALRLLRGK